MRIKATAALTAIMVLGVAGAALADGPYGTWTRPSTGGKVSFYACGDKLCAKVVSDPKNKANNGTVIMSGAAKTGANAWTGDLLNLDDGNTYTGTVTISGGGLTLKGCALAGLLCKSETWSQ
jgi:uncharacterized protein (DUF2147 family)